MATASLGRLTLDLVAQIGQFTDPLDRAERKAKDSADKMSKSFRSFGDQLKDAFGGTQLGSSIDFLNTKLNSLRGGALVATGAIAGMVVGGVAIGTIGLAKMSIETAKADVQLQILANRANTSVKNFQILEQASLGFGVSQEQLGSILADVQEKLGEFSATKGGGGADFFDALKNNTKLTEAQIKSFSKTLQGKDGIGAIQAISDKLDELDVSKQERRFIFESLASDLGNLAPLFAENGRLINDFGVALEDAGVIKTEEAIKRSQLLAAQTQALSLQFQGWKNQLVSGFMPAITDVGNAIFGTSKNGLQLQEVGEGIGTVLRSVTKVALGASAVFVVTGKLIGGIAASIAAMKGEKLNTANIMFDDIQATLDEYADKIKTADGATTQATKSNNLLVNSLLAVNSASNQTSSGLKTNTEDAKENEKATKKQAEAKAKLAKEQENLNKMVGATALTGLRIKSSEAFAGGNVRAYTANFAQMTQSAFGSNLGRFTAFNDLYHKGTNSKHTTGNAFDFTIADAKKSGEAVKQLEDMAKRYGYVVKILDEYKNKSSRATGGHIHVSVLGFKGTAQMQKDAQAELDIIGKTNDDALKISLESARKQLSVKLKLGGDLAKIELQNLESIKEINEAFTENDPNRQKYLDLQKLVYQKDLKEFEKTQEAKRIATYNSINDPINSMRDKGVEAIAQSSLSPLAYQKWDLNRQQQDGYSQLGDDLSTASMAINDSDVLSEQEKKDKLLQIEQEYQDAKLALAQTYDQQHRDLENQTQAASLAGYGAMFGMMGSMFDAYGDKESTGYKVAFAMQKAFVLSSAILNAKGAVMAAWNDPSNTTIWQKMAAAAATVVQTNDLMSAIQGVALTGMAHDGIANIPEEGTWLLNKGERVLNPQDNKAFTNMINNGGGGGDITIQVNVTDSGVSTSGGNTQDQRQLAQVIGNTVRAVIIQEKRQGGLLSK